MASIARMCFFFFFLSLVQLHLQPSSVTNAKAHTAAISIPSASSPSVSNRISSASAATGPADGDAPARSQSRGMFTEPRLDERAHLLTSTQTRANSTVSHRFRRHPKDATSMVKTAASGIQCLASSKERRTIRMGISALCKST